MKLNKIFVSGIMLSMVFLLSCGGGESKKTEEMPQPGQKTEEVANPMEDIGIGPVKSITLSDKVDEAMAQKGNQVYQEKCKSCHNEYKKYIGPAPVGVLKRRSPEWVMNMILNPEEMVQKDPIAKGLIRIYASPMANQHLTQDEARQVLEYFRTLKEN
jgi:cytochrome c